MRTDSKHFNEESYVLVASRRCQTDFNIVTIRNTLNKIMTIIKRYNMIHKYGRTVCNMNTFFSRRDHSFVNITFKYIYTHIYVQLYIHVHIYVNFYLYIISLYR